MAYDLEEQESIDNLKAWWKQHGRLVIAGVTVFVAVTVGAQVWRWYRNDMSSKAAILFEAVQDGAQSGDAKRTREAAGQLIDKFSGTAYAGKAALIAAKVNYQNNDATSAKSQLKWAMEHADEPEVKDMARLRLAGVLLDEKAYDEALKLLDQASLPAFAPLYSDLKGDVLLAKGKPDEARAAYAAAMEKMDQKSGYRRVIEMKRDALGA